jgi:hypothetical protein
VDLGGTAAAPEAPVEPGEDLVSEPRSETTSDAPSEEQSADDPSSPLSEPDDELVSSQGDETNSEES